MKSKLSEWKRQKKENKLSEAEIAEAEKFIREFGNPVTTPIKWWQKIFYPIEYFYIREALYYDIKSGRFKIK